MNALSETFSAIIPVGKINIKEDAMSKMTKEKMKENLKKLGVQLYETKEAEFAGSRTIREIERVVLLKVIDNKWMSHIDDMEQLRQGIGLQAYGQRDPLVEYKMSGYEMFDGI